MIFVANLYVAPGMQRETSGFLEFLILYLSSIWVLALGHIIVFAAVIV